MSINTWIVVAGDPAVGTLIETARALGGRVCAAVVGPKAVADTVAAGGVDKVVWFGEPGQVPVEAFAMAVADVIEVAPGVVFGASRASDRVLLGGVAARLQAPVLTTPSSVLAQGDTVVVTCSRFAGIAEETVTVTGTSRPDLRHRRKQMIDTTDPAAAAAELVAALRADGVL